MKSQESDKKQFQEHVRNSYKVESRILQSNLKMTNIATQTKNQIFKVRTHLDQGWTMRRWMIMSRRRARGRPRAPGRNGAASGGENPGLVAEQHFPDFLRTFADHLRPPEPPFQPNRPWFPRSTSNLLQSHTGCL